ncbi:hypothetical protein [Sphingomonas sp. DT-204]|uniref:hypothetical protein n=1 Tax=Sphingomonas sp. DT-204 TaxID=3396166 RepID=UPI003F1DF0B9
MEGQIETRLTRRMMLGAAAALASMPGAAFAQIQPGDEVVDLWPGDPPGRTDVRIVRKIDDQSRDTAEPDRWVTGIDRPVLVVRRPARPNGSAVLVVPGGGYGFLSYDNEGTSQAAWLNEGGNPFWLTAVRFTGFSDNGFHPDDPALVNRDLAIEDNVVATVSQDCKDNAAILTIYVTGARISTDNIAAGNWHSSETTGGWLDEIGNVARGDVLLPGRDWPAEARAAIARAGVRPCADCRR